MFFTSYFQTNAFCEENFEGRRGVARNTADAVDAYCEARIGATTKYSPKLFRKIKNALSDRKDAHALYHLTYLTICAHFYVWLTARPTLFGSAARK